MGFHGEALLAPRPTPKLEDHPSSAVRDCLFNLSAATLHIGGRSSIRNLRTRHAVVTGTHLTWLDFTYCIYIYIYICVCVCVCVCMCVCIHIVCTLEFMTQTQSNEVRKAPAFWSGRWRMARAKTDSYYKVLCNSRFRELQTLLLHV